MIDASLIFSVLESILPLLIVMFVVILVFAFAKIRAARAIGYVTVIPEFNLGNLKFYEVASLTDNSISNTDIVAIACYYYLNKIPAPDELELELIQKYGNKEYLNRLRNQYLEVKATKAWAAIVESIIKYSIIRSVSVSIYRKLIQNKFYTFNPAVFSNILIIAMLIAVIVGAALVSSGIYSDLLLNWLLVIAGCGVFIPYFPYLFAENLRNISSIRTKILGYKMFLKTTEYYTVKKDNEKFVKYIPYFLVFGIHNNHYLDMLDYCLDN